MNQRWWIAIVAVVGIGLAVLLFPRPDTGEAISSGSPASEENAVPRTPGKTRTTVDPDRTRTGVKPGGEARAAARNRPEAIYASKLVTPFSAIRFTLMKEGTDPAKALAEEIGTLMNDQIRKVRLDPDAVPWAELETNMDAMIAKISASSFASDETIAKSLGRYKEFVAEYHQAKSTEGAPPVTGAPDDIPPGAPPGTPPAEPAEE